MQFVLNKFILLKLSCNCFFLIFREMWRKIYRGNDIDYIEIKTESSMTVDSERRKYDYRYFKF